MNWVLTMWLKTCGPRQNPKFAVRLFWSLETKRLKNIVTIKTGVELEISLEDSSVDVVLLYDVLHSRSVPKADDRSKLLNEVHNFVR